MMHHKLQQIFAGMLLAVLLIGCTSPAGTTVAPAPSGPASTKVTAGGADPTPAAETVRPTVGPKEAGTGAPASSLSPQGPWLFYVHNIPRPGMYDVSDVPPELILLNQDGSGRTPVQVSGCFDASSQPGSAGYLAKIDSGLYLVQPAEAAAMIVDEYRPYPNCETFFQGDQRGGLLAVLDGAVGDLPELIVYELPAGTIRDRFPLVECTGDPNACDAARSIWSELQSVRPQWSPNGRYLAYAALVDASSDLFVYDSQERSVRRLTHGPDWVGPLEWSPDGSQIVMQELLNQELVDNGASMAIPSSVWAVSVGGNEIRQLYLTHAQYGQQNIFQWLDNERFIAYEGSLDPMDGALNPRFVDMKNGTDRLLLDDWFGTIRLDPVHETLALFKQPTEKSPDGIYLISLESGTVRRLGDGSYSLDVDDWDPKTGLFVSSVALPGGSTGIAGVRLPGKPALCPPAAGNAYAVRNSGSSSAGRKTQPDREEWSLAVRRRPGRDPDHPGSSLRRDLVSRFDLLFLLRPRSRATHGPCITFPCPAWQWTRWTKASSPRAVINGWEVEGKWVYRQRIR